ncbi:hypothetical protein WJX72_011499 [[Myrmecia] bisecta]|uniref:CW-type domain-containing protein n=1 Tax=[Myrmecia] bisecta TaxID=41462 RepID=A0AAW1Q1Q4_9CHLO
MGKESGGGRSVSAGAGSGGASRPSTKPKKAVWVWCQCDQCEKWRKLPPATTVDENAPWYCYMNPDERRNECSDSEESYDAATEQQVFDDSSGDEQVLSPRQQQQQRGGRGHGRKGKGKRGRPPVPKSGGRLANGSGNWTPGGKGSGKAVRWENGAQEGGQYKRGAAAMESPEYQTGAKRQRTGAPPSGPASRLGAGPSRLGPSGSGQAPLDGMAGQYGGYGIKPEDQGPQQLSPQGSLRKLRGVNKAKKAHTGFEKIMGSGGIWEIVKGRGRAVTAPPQWIWEGLATYAPQAAELACQAADVASAAKYFETAVEPANLEQAKQAAVTSRIALATAAAIAAATTARITTAAGDPPAVVPVWGTPQPIPSGMVCGLLKQRQ